MAKIHLKILRTTIAGLAHGKRNNFVDNFLIICRPSWPKYWSSHNNLKVVNRICPNLPNILMSHGNEFHYIHSRNCDSHIHVAGRTEKKCNIGWCEMNSWQFGMSNLITFIRFQNYNEVRKRQARVIRHSIRISPAVTQIKTRLLLICC